jgi:hypothetical protein
VNCLKYILKRLLIFVIKTIVLTSKRVAWSWVCCEATDGNSKIVILNQVISRKGASLTLIDLKITKLVYCG